MLTSQHDSPKLSNTPTMDSNNLFDNRYKLIKKLGQGTNGTVYSATDTNTNTTVVVKIGKLPLRCEAIVYVVLHRHWTAKGIPRMLKYSKNGTEYLVMDKLGKSILHYWRSCRCIFSLKTVAMLGIQMISLLETVHNRGIVHCDVKEDNFVMDEQCQSLYIIDFGISSCYINPNTSRHLDERRDEGLLGTLFYASINTHKKIRVSRRDDLESVAYVLIRLSKGFLPWTDIDLPDDFEKAFRRIGNEKMATGIDTLCEGLSEHIKQLVVYVRELKFAERPDYSYIRGLLERAIQDKGLENDGVYDWMVNQPSS